MSAHVEKKPFPVKLCGGCNKAFEVDENKKLWHHEGFPTYGLEKGTCSDSK